MRVQTNDPAVVDDLIDFLVARHCVVARTGENVVAVAIPKSLREDAACAELDRYLEAWKATRPGADARRVDGGAETEVASGRWAAQDSNLQPWD